MKTSVYSFISFFIVFRPTSFIFSESDSINLDGIDFGGVDLAVKIDGTGVCSLSSLIVESRWVERRASSKEWSPVMEMISNAGYDSPKLSFTRLIGWETYTISASTKLLGSLLGLERVASEKLYSSGVGAEYF